MFKNMPVQLHDVFFVFIAQKIIPQCCLGQMIIAEIGWTWQTDNTFKGTAKAEFTHQANLMEG